MCGEIKPSEIFKRPKYIQCSVKLPSFGVVLVSLVFCMVASETFLQVMHAAVHDSLFYTLTLFVISFFFSNRGHVGKTGTSQRHILHQPLPRQPACPVQCTRLAESGQGTRHCQTGSSNIGRVLKVSYMLSFYADL